jgi:hypothetical protein
MSAFGQQQTFAPHKAMSALPPKADMCSASRDVRYGPIADMRAHHSVETSGDNAEVSNSWFCCPTILKPPMRDPLRMRHQFQAKAPIVNPEVIVQGIVNNGIGM